MPEKADLTEAEQAYFAQLIKNAYAINVGLGMLGGSFNGEPSLSCMSPHRAPV